MTRVHITGTGLFTPEKNLFQTRSWSQPSMLMLKISMPNTPQKLRPELSKRLPRPASNLLKKHPALKAVL